MVISHFQLIKSFQTIKESLKNIFKHQEIPESNLGQKVLKFLVKGKIAQTRNSIHIKNFTQLEMHKLKLIQQNIKKQLGFHEP